MKAEQLKKIVENNRNYISIDSQVELGHIIKVVKDLLKEKIRKIQNEFLKANKGVNWEQEVEATNKWWKEKEKYIYS